MPAVIPVRYPTREEQADKRQALIEHLVSEHGADEGSHVAWPMLAKLRVLHTATHTPGTRMDEGVPNHVHDHAEVWS